jgi:hypothetical protein
MCRLVPLFWTGLRRRRSLVYLCHKHIDSAEKIESAILRAARQGRVRTSAGTNRGCAAGVPPRRTPATRQEPRTASTAAAALMDRCVTIRPAPALWQSPRHDLHEGPRPAPSRPAPRRHARRSRGACRPACGRMGATAIDVRPPRPAAPLERVRPAGSTPRRRDRRPHARPAPRSSGARPPARTGRQRARDLAWTPPHP